ncbi:MAG: iron-containing alcohol dehydrogenase [Verrucomicrobiae bacterium]|nr:iron-containing alcohol dehydrogenase [Verrucomicrobiae bacterium]
MHFEFATAGRIVFGAGRLAELGNLAQPFGSRALVVTGSRSEPGEQAAQRLADAGIFSSMRSIRGEPSVEEAIQGASWARTTVVEMVVAIGGGSVLDAGKAIAALAANRDDPLDYLEVIGAGRPLPNAPLPFIAIPTTAGTGSEVTRNAVLASREHRVKVSLRSPRMLPSVALLDPELTVSLPPGPTATTGLDAITQLIEAAVSARANPLTDTLCREGLLRAVEALPRAVRDGGDLAARTDLQFAALCSGFALANAGLGAVHGLAGPIGGRFPAPHGAVCAALLIPILRGNLRALQEREPESPALGRFRRVAHWVGGRRSAAASDLVPALEALTAPLGVPGLSHHGISAADFPELIRQSRQSSSMKGNPVTLRDDELHEALAAAL